ncbi:DUF6053 domain-containing protein [Lysobacter enzymogenes]
MGGPSGPTLSDPIAAT